MQKNTASWRTKNLGGLGELKNPILTARYSGLGFLGILGLACKKENKILGKWKFTTEYGFLKRKDFFG